MVDSIGSRRVCKAGAPALVATLALLAGGSSAARADLMRYQFSGMTTPNGSPTPTPFSGTVAYDPTEATSKSSNSPGYKSTAFGNFWNVPGTPADSSGLTLNVGGTNVISETGGLGVAVYQPTGLPQPLTGLSFTSTLGQPLQATISFSNPSKAVFSTLEPPSAINTSDFNGATLLVYQNTNNGGAPGQSLLYSGQITGFSPVPSTPEPSTAALLGVGGLGLYLRARSRRLSDRSIAG